MKTHSDIKSLSDEKKRALKVDITNMPEWEAQIKSLLSDLSSKYSILEFVAIKDYLDKVRCSTLRNVIFSTYIYRRDIEYFNETVMKNGHPLSWILPHSIFNASIADELKKELIRQEGRHLSKINEAAERGVSDNIFSSKVRSSDLAYAKNELVELNNLKSLIPHFEKIQDRIREFEEDQRNCRNKVSKLKNELLKANEKKGAIERFEAKHGKSFAKAAAADKKTRDRASELKKLVKKSENCPYCGLALGTRPHLDHIYPVSKGGLSITENLIWCCAKCNSEKTDKGLIEFITLKRFDIAIVVQRLHSMNKHI